MFRRVVVSAAHTVPYGSDILMYLWNCWHVNHALIVEHASPYFTRWLMYPVGTTLILHTLGLSAILPWLPLTLLAKGPAGIVLSYNAELLGSFVLSGLGTYVLAAGETDSRLGALAAGIMFSFSAHRLSQLGWADLLTAHYLLFYFVCLTRGLRREGVSAFVLAGILLALVAYNSYTQLYLALLLTPPLAVTQRGRKGRVLGKLAVTAAVAGVLTAPLLWLLYRDFFSGQLAWGTLRPELVWDSSADPRDFLFSHHLPSALAALPCALLPGRCAQLAASQSFFSQFGSATWFIGSSLGYSLLLLAAAGAVGARREGAARWVVFGLGFLLLSLGPNLRFTGGPIYKTVPLPYAWLRPLPGFAMSKNPDRFVMPAILCLSVAGAFGVKWLCRWAGDRQQARWRVAAVRGAILCAVIGECCAAAPSAQRVEASPIARQLANDHGDYAVVYYPLANLLDREYGMWEQVVHGKRLVAAFIARAPNLPELYTEPGYFGVLSPAAFEAPVEQQIKRIDVLVRNSRYRAKYLVVLHRVFTDAEKRRALLQELSRRYPLVSAEPAPLAGLLGRYSEQSVFYVGQPNFDATRQQLESQAEALRTAAHDSAAAGNAQDIKDRLAADWKHFAESCAQRELETPEFAQTRDLVTAALAMAQSTLPLPR